MPTKPPRRSSSYVNALYRMGLACLVAGVIFAILFPVYGDRLTGYSRAFQNVLSKHKMPPYIGHYRMEHNREISNREPCLLDISWFPEGKAYEASGCAVGVEGTVRRTRILWNNGTHGGYDQPITDLDEMDALRRIATLPPGLESPYDVTYGKLLIISSEQRGQWMTRYYDRAHLPAPINKLIQLLHLELNPRPFTLR